MHASNYFQHIPALFMNCLVSFSDALGLSNLVTTKACRTKNSSSSIDELLIN